MKLLQIPGDTNKIPTPGKGNGHCLPTKFRSDNLWMKIAPNLGEVYVQKCWNKWSYHRNNEVPMGFDKILMLMIRFQRWVREGNGRIVPTVGLTVNENLKLVILLKKNDENLFNKWCFKVKKVHIVIRKH